VHQAIRLHAQPDFFCEWRSIDAEKGANSDLAHAAERPPLTR
jgi:hypothetical protein